MGRENPQSDIKIKSQSSNGHIQVRSAILDMTEFQSKQLDYDVGRPQAHFFY